MTVFMSYAYLLHSEEVAASEFALNLPMAESIMPTVIDCLFQMNYFVQQPPSPPPDGLHFFQFERCLTFPYKLRALWLLCQRGHYVTSVALVRQVVEAFVQVRYFSKYPAGLVKHLTSQKQAGRVQFRTMFEELSPGSYEKVYKHLSGVAHSGLAMSVILSLQHETTDEGKILTPAGSEFNEKSAAYVANHTLMLALGIVRCFPEWFPSYSAAVDAETEKLRVLVLNGLEEWRGGHRQVYPQAEEWHQRIDLLMGGVST